MVAGVGFFTDACVVLTDSICVLTSYSILRYDIFAINIASPMLGYVYGHSESL
jgi:hypothetical protein